VTLFRTLIAVDGTTRSGVRSTIECGKDTSAARIRYNIFPTILQKTTMRTLACYN